jgi:hypothetical protein
VVQKGSRAAVVDFYGTRLVVVCKDGASGDGREDDAARIDVVDDSLGNGRGDELLGFCRNRELEGKCFNEIIYRGMVARDVLPMRSADCS